MNHDKLQGICSLAERQDDNMSSPFTILLAEDENNIASFITTILTANNYQVIRAESGAETMMMVTSRCPDLLLLDLGLPDFDGQQIIKTVRSWSQMPIIVVSARTHERDKVEALDLGADDYITKPFGTGELLARVRTALRRMQANGTEAGGTQSGKYVCGDLTVNFDRRQTLLNGVDVHLTQNEYKIVALLAAQAGRVLTYDFLIHSIWGPHAGEDNQILRVNMANIRRKIEKNPAEPQFIFTEMGVGYRMAEAD